MKQGDEALAKEPEAAAPDRYVPGSVVVRGFEALMVATTIALYGMASGVLTSEPGSGDVVAEAPSSGEGGELAPGGR